MRRRERTTLYVTSQKTILQKVTSGLEPNELNG